MMKDKAYEHQLHNGTVQDIWPIKSNTLYYMQYDNMMVYGVSS